VGCPLSTEGHEIPCPEFRVAKSGDGLRATDDAKGHPKESDDDPPTPPNRSSVSNYELWIMNDELPVLFTNVIHNS